MSQSSPLGISGVSLTTSHNSRDSRGNFIKYTPDNFFVESLDSVAVSINPQVGTIRGIHFQVAPFAEEKIISCIQGSSFEVIIDLRPDSPTYGQTSTFELSEENFLQVYLPIGVAHGFQTLMPNTIIHYCLTSKYSPLNSYSINPIGDIEISWPMKDTRISEKDRLGMSFGEAAQVYADSLIQ